MATDMIFTIAENPCAGILDRFILLSGSVDDALKA